MVLLWPAQITPEFVAVTMQTSPQFIGSSIRDICIRLLKSNVLYLIAEISDQ